MVDYGGAVLPLTVDDSELKRSLAGMLGSFKTFGSQVDDVMSNLGRFTIAATGLYALKKAFDATTGAALSFNQQLKATWAVAEGINTRGELRALGGEVRNLARQFNMTSTEAQHAMYEINQSVFYGADALVILKESAKGAAAGLTDVYTVADMMTTVLNAYGMAATESAHINDVLFQTVLYGKVTMNELASEFGRLAGVAAPVGASLEEVSAAIATLTRLGIDTDTAVTAIRQSLFQILRPSKALMAAINALGYTTGRSMVQANGFAKSLQLLVDYGNASGVEMETLFSNIRAVLAILPLTSTAASDYADDLLRVGDSAGAADTAFKKITSSWLYQIQNLKVILNDLAISIGQLVVPAIQAFLKTVQLLLTPLAHVAEFLGQIGGQQLVVLATVLGTVTLATIGLTKAWAKLATVFAAKSIADMPLIIAKIGTALSLLGGGITGGALLKGAGLLGLGALGLGAVVKGIIVDLPIALDPQVSGAERTRAAITTAFETALGAPLAGAVIASMFGMSAPIGAAIATVGAVLTIIIKHQIERYAHAKEAATTGISKALSIPKTLAESESAAAIKAIQGPSNILDFLPKQLSANISKYSKGISPILEIINQIIEARPDLQAISDQGYVRSALYDIIDGLYESSPAFNEYGQLVRKLRSDLEKAETSAPGLSDAISDFTNQYRTLAKLSGAPSLKKTVVDEIDMARYSFMKLWDELKAGNLTGEEATKKWEDLTKVTDYWSQQAEIAEKAGTASATTIRSFADELQNLVDPQLAQTWKQQVSSLVDVWKNGATMETRITAGQSLQSLGKTLSELADDPAYSQFKDALLGLVTTIEAAGIRIGDVANPLVESWKTLSGKFSSGRLSLDDFIAKLRDAALAHSDSKEAILYFYGKLNDLSGELDEGVSAQQFFQTSLNLSESAARELASALGLAESKVQSFAEKLASVNISGFVSGINNLLAEINKGIGAAKTLTDVEGILAGYEAIAGTGDMKTRLERVFNTQWAVESMTQEHYNKLRAFYDSLGDFSLGKTNAELQEEANRATEEAADAQKAAAQEACSAAQQALDDAYAAQQEAFRAMFETPIIKALRGGDFVGAAEEIQGLAERFHELAAEGAPLGVSAQELLSMIQGAKSGLESALDGLISISGKNKDLVYALEELKKQVETTFEATGSELQQAAAKVRWEDILSGPAEAGAKIRAFAEEDMKAAHEMEQELIKQMEEQIAQLQAFSYDTSKQELSLEELKNAVEGTSSTLGVLRIAFKEFADELNTLITTLFPGKFGQFLTKLVSLAGSVVNANWGGKGLGNLATPKLAEGGITTDATLAMIGEAGPEAIIPLDQLPSLMANMGWTPAGGFAGTGNAFDAAWAGGSTYDVTGFGNVGGADTASIVAEANALAGSIGAAVSTLISAIRSARRAIEGLAAEASGITAVPQISTIPVITASPEELALQQHLWEKMQEIQAQIEAQSTAFPAPTNAFADEAAAIGLSSAFPQGKQYPSTGPETMAQWQPFVPAPTEGLDTGAVCDAISKAIKDAFDGLDFKMPKRDEIAEEDKAKSSVFDSLKTMWSGLKQMFSKGGFGAGLETLVGGLKEFQTSGGLAVLNGFVGAIAFVTDLLIQNWKDVMADLKESFSKTFEMLGNVAGKVYDYLRMLPSLFAELVSVSQQLVSTFSNLIQNTEVYSRLQTALQDITSKIFNALLGFLWPIVAVLEKLLGVTEETTDSLNSLNVPAGYKVTRAEWKAATPGEPAVSSSTAGDLPAWVQALLDKFGDAIEKVLAPFKKFFEILEEAWKVVGEAILEGMLPALEKFGTNLVALAETVRDDLLPLFEKHLPNIVKGSLDFVFGYITGVATFFVETLKNTIANLDPFALALGRLGDNLPALFKSLADGLDKPLNELIVSFTDLVDRINSDLVPELLTHLPNAVQGLADLIFGAYEGIGEFAFRLTQQLLPSLAEFSLTLGGIGDQLGGLGASLAEAIGPVIETLLGGLTGLGAWISGTLIPDMQGLLEGFLGWWNEAGQQFVESEVFVKIGELGQVVYDWLKDFVSFIGNEILPWVTSDLWTTLEGVLGDVVDAFQGIWSTIKDNWGPISKWLIAQIEKWGVSIVATAEKAEVLGLAAIGEFWQAQHALWESESISLWDKLKISFGIGVQQIIDALGPHLTKLGEAFGELMSALQPVWEILGGALLIALKALAVVIDIITAGFKVLKTILDIILWPFKLIGGILKWLFGGGDTEDEIEVDASASTAAASPSTSTSTSTASPSTGTSTSTPPVATTGAWSASRYWTSKWQGSSIYDMLSEIGVGKSLADSIAAAWAGTGLSEMDFVGILGSLYDTGKFTKSALKAVLSSGKSGAASWTGFTVPGLKKGGFTLTEGLAYLHKHEYVIPAQTASLAAAGIGGNMVIKNYTVLDGKVVAESTNRVNASRETRATGGPSGRRWSRSG